MATNDHNVCFRTSIGGQALMEGILMRGPDKQAIVCRTENGIVEKVEPLNLPKDKYPILGWPFVRGIVTFADSMVKGMRALTYSASLLPEEEQEQPSKFDLWLEKKLGSEKAEKYVIGIAAVLGVLLAVALFILLPTLIAGFIPGIEGHYTLRSLIEGVIKIVIFLVYLGLVAHMKEIKRLFSYHGAEHKTIFCYEKGLPLTVENVRPQSRFHPRCGTSFLLVVIILGLCGPAHPGGQHAAAHSAAYTAPARARRRGLRNQPLGRPPRREYRLAHRDLAWQTAPAPDH